MAIDDNASYQLTGAQVKDLANKIKAKAADNTFVGATSALPGSKGLIPAPQAGDDTKFLSGDGTWKNVTADILYIYADDASIPNESADLYSDISLTTVLSIATVANAISSGKRIILAAAHSGSIDSYSPSVYCTADGKNIEFIYSGELFHWKNIGGLSWMEEKILP